MSRVQTGINIRQEIMQIVGWSRYALLVCVCVLVWLAKLVIAFVMRVFHTRSQPSFFAHTGLFFWLHKHAWRKVMMNTTNMTKKINVNFYMCKCMKEIKEIAMKNWSLSKQKQSAQRDAFLWQAWMFDQDAHETNAILFKLGLLEL